MEFKVKCCGNCYHYYARKKILCNDLLTKREHTNICSAGKEDCQCPLNIFDEMRCKDYKPASKRHLLKNIAFLSSSLCTFQAIKNEPCKHHEKNGLCRMRDARCMYETDYEKCHRYEL